MKKRALVAGAAGFIASHLCDSLLLRGYAVIAVDNLITGRLQNLAAATKHGLQFVQHDIAQPLVIDGPIDEIYNMASPASPIDFARIPVVILETVSHGHRNLLDLARHKNARLLFASSSEVYGDSEVHPQTESYCGNVNPIGPRSCYDEAKRFGEALSFAYHRQYGVDIRIARIFNTYGPRLRPDDGRIIPNFFMQALRGQSLTIYGDGSQTRSFCFISDLIDGLHRLMASDERRPVNMGNPVEHHVLQVAQIINALTRNQTPVQFLPLPENDPKRRRPSTNRAHASLGWRPQIELEEGLRRSMTYFMSELKIPGAREEGFADSLRETPGLS